MSRKALWFGVLAGPVLWFAQLNVNYGWEELGACSPSNTDRGLVFGVGVRTLVVVVNAAVTVVVVAALAGSVRGYRRTGPVEAQGVRTTEHQRDVAHWLALAGIVNSLLFLLLIVVGFAPAVVLRTCQTGL
jgi:hypothetical protein